MSNVNDLKSSVNTKTLNLVLLTIATAGIYFFLWIYKSNKILIDITKTKLVDETYIIWMAVCIGLSSAASGNGNALLEILSGLLLIATNVLYIVWAFKAKRALEEYALNELKIDLRLNAFYTFILTAFYINYCINNLPTEQRRQDVLRGQTGSQQA